MAQTNEWFDKAFFATMHREGFYSNDHVDPGGETYMGISRTYWPSWEGWPLVQKVFTGQSDLIPDLLDAVEKFYLVNFWERIQGDVIAEISPDIAMEVFDTAVNMGETSGPLLLQEALNLLNNGGRIYPDLLPDGQIGKKTVTTLRLYMSTRPPSRSDAEARLLRVMNCLQGCHYINQMKKFPDREKFRGWFDRI